jgi:flagellar motor switch protein FliM
VGDILSQSEIDSLLNALTSGDTSTIELEQEQREKDVKVYDFANPQKFSKEQLRTFEIIFDNYSRLLSSFLTGYLRTNVHAEVVNSEQITYNNFTNSLTTPTILGIVDFEPFKGSIILELSTNIGYAIIDRVLGGPGYPMSEVRDLSDIEKVLIERVFVQLLKLMPEPWENVADISPKLDTLETNVQFAQVLAPNEQTALVTLDLNVGGAQGYFNFCIPYIVIEPMAQQINTANWFRSKKLDATDEKEKYAKKVEQKLEKALLDVRAVIGQTKITVGEFVNLAEGDIILLDTYINSELDVKVGNLHKFTAKPGVSRGKNAIQIMSLVGRRE